MDFYYLPPSTPCRAVLMTAEALGLKLNKKLLDLPNGAHLKPEYLKLNPTHTIPTLVDNDFSIYESRAIMIYLAEKYGRNDSLYPKAPEKKALVNQCLYFDIGTLYKGFLDYYYPMHFLQKPANPEMYKKIEVAFGFLNTFLDGQNYVAGDHLTIADISILASVSTFDVLGFPVRNYANVAKWYENCKKVVPGWKENWDGCLALKAFIESKKQK